MPLLVIDRREWWLWSSAASAMLLLALGIASFSVPAMMARPDGSYAFFPGESVRGFMGLVLVFNVYIVTTPCFVFRVAN
jgi:hypothetical protein